MHVLNGEEVQTDNFLWEVEGICYICSPTVFPLGQCNFHAPLEPPEEGERLLVLDTEKYAAPVRFVKFKNN